MIDPAGSAAPRSDRGAGPRRSGASYRRALQVGLGISLVVHVVAIFLYTRMAPVHVDGPVRFYVPDTGTSGGGGMRIVQIEPREDAESRPRPAAPVKVETHETPAVEAGPPDLSAPGEGGGIVAPGPTAAERLRPHLSDWRVWAPLDEALNELTLKQRLELELSGRIAEWQDSVAAALAENRALTDWTKTDDQGRRWGIADGKLYLGNISIPIPFNFGMPVGRRDEFRRAEWEWNEIQRQGVTGAISDSWKDRAKAIRERRDKERAKAKADTSGVHH